ncbi:MAG: nuclear transport factor 2 family protein [Pseudomonadota bacterium]
MTSEQQLYEIFRQSAKQPGDWAPALHALFAPQAVINVVHPFNAMSRDAYLETFLGGLNESFLGLSRRDDIVMSGCFEEHSWISVTGYYAGRFDAPWLGLKPTQELAYLRYGEFYRFDQSQVVEAYVFLDLPELMMATHQWPIATGPGLSRGYTGLIQGPASQDGLIWDRDTSRGDDSSQRVTEMLRALNTPDEAWRPFWHQDMMWYGPGAFGSFKGIEAFRSFQVPFESQFEGWSGGAAGNGLTSHFARFGHGDYVCSGGWP